MFVIRLGEAASRFTKRCDESMYPINFHLARRPLRQGICCVLNFWLVLAVYLCKYQLKRICTSPSALSNKSCTIRIGHITFQQNSVKKPSSKPSSRVINFSQSRRTPAFKRNQVFRAASEENYLPNLPLNFLHAVCCLVS